MLQNFLNKGLVQHDSSTLLALSTVAMKGVEPGMMAVAAKGEGDQFLRDLTGVYGTDGGFPRQGRYGRRRTRRQPPQQ